MLIGTPKQGAGENGTTDIFDVGTPSEFEGSVLNGSMHRPVLVDFWAPWCGPCRQLMPVLESVVSARAGQVALAKVNVDENPELAQAFRVQSVPMIVAIYMGRPVTAFAGARPQAEIENLVDQLIALHEQQQAGAPEGEAGPDIETILKEAASLLEKGNYAGAQDLYVYVLGTDPENAEAYAGMVRIFIAVDELEQAQGLIDSVPPAIREAAPFAAAIAALDAARSVADMGGLGSFEKKIVANPDDWQAWFDLAEACNAKGMKAKAVDALIEIVRRNKAWEDGKARLQLLAYFEAWGFADPASVEGRKKLSALLFS